VNASIRTATVLLAALTALGALAGPALLGGTHTHSAADTTTVVATTPSPDNEDWS
jgi:hypothetical protein